MPSNTHTRANRYGSIAAEIYDIDKPIGSMPDTAFYKKRLAGIGGPILEPACGTGRALVPLLDAGHPVTGFDASPDMLERCKSRCSARSLTPNLSQQRFEDFRYSEPFAAVIVPVGTFTLIDDFDAALSVLRRIRSHLSPQGLALFDILPLQALARTEPDRRSWTTASGELLTLEGHRISTDWRTQTTTTHIRYERWSDNRLMETHLEPMAYRQWGVEEFALALRATGFSEIKVVGDYDPARGPRSTDRMFTFEAVNP